MVELEGDRAVVRVRYPLFGREVRFEQPMLRIDGGWYREDAVQGLERALAEEAAARGEPPIAGGDAPAPALSL